MTALGGVAELVARDPKLTIKDRRLGRPAATNYSR